MEAKLETFIHSDDKGHTGIMPVYKTKGAACADIAVPCRVALLPGAPVKVDLLISFSIPKGYKVAMYPRSSLLIKKCIVQPVSIIDCDYTGHVHAPLVSLSTSRVYLEAGERVGQIELVPANRHSATGWRQDYEERSQEGFGGTGAV